MTYYYAGGQGQSGHFSSSTNIKMIRTLLIISSVILLVSCSMTSAAAGTGSRSSTRISSRSASKTQGQNVTAGSAKNSVLRVPGDLQAVYSTKGKSVKTHNKHRGSRGPMNAGNVTSVNGTTPQPDFEVSSDPGKSLNLAKAGPKQSWLAVASAVAHSAAAETNEPTGATMSTTDDSKPTKYHYYPHNQHLYLLPECATQQVCSAVYLRLNYSQPLCACPNFHEPCSVSTRTDDRHTIPLVTGSNSQVLTLVKTCESTSEVRECRAPKDWSILALQNSRTGKAHYLVICRCPANGFLEGPIAHSQPAYARVPGIRVYGMTCVRATSRTGRRMNYFDKDSSRDDSGGNPNFPWHKLKTLIHSSMSS